MRSFEKRRVLVAGSGGGIGKAIARRFAYGGARVLLVACSRNDLDDAAIELANLLVARPIAVTRTSAKKKALLDLGAAEVIASTEEDLRALIRRYTDRKGADLIFDAVAGSFLETLAQATAPGAQIIECGWLSAQPTPFPLFMAFQKGLTVRGYNIYEFVNDRLLRPVG